MNKIRFKNVTVTKKFVLEKNESKIKTVLKNLSFEINEGEIFAVMGPSGAGKTSILRLINRLEDPKSGEIFIDEKNIKEYQIHHLRRKIGFVFQLPFIFEGTVLDNILYGPNIAGENSDKSMEKAAQYLPWFGFDEEILNRDPNRLSVGEKQRVCILRALMNNPDTLLMDEPTSSLDPSSANRILELIKDINSRQKTTIALVTHTPQHAEKISQKSMIIIDGELAYTGSTENIFKSSDPRIVNFLEGRYELSP